jgi:hypothetical protein
MDEHGVDDWLYRCTLIGFWLKSWANHIRWFLSRLDHKSDPAWLIDGPDDQPKTIYFPSSEYIKRWWHGWEWNWLTLWMMYSDRILAKKLGKSHQLIFVIPQQQIWPSMTHMGHGPDDQPKTIHYHHLNIQEMMVRMNMELIGSMDVVW